MFIGSNEVKYDYIYTYTHTIHIELNRIGL